MDDLYRAGEATDFPGVLGQCVYCTRLIGSDPNLVLHGGGNSSVKVPYEDITGRTIEALYVKGSGWDMATIETPGFTPLPIDRMRSLLQLDELSDPDMMRELASAKLDPGAPNPSVETLLHAYLPHQAVQHSHADCIVNLTNVGNGADVVADGFGDRVLTIPYVKPGFDLAKLVRDMWSDHGRDDLLGMVLLNHGLFTFGADSAEAYRRHVELISAAETWLDRNAPPAVGDPPSLPDVLLTDLADLRRELSAAAGAPLIVERHTCDTVRTFVRRADLADLATRGPLTPDHIIRTKRTPLIGTDVAGFVTQYEQYFAANQARSDDELTMLDPAPRVVLDPMLGMMAAGGTPGAARVAADIYHHTMPVLARAEDHLGGYVALSEADLFDMEYWDLEQAKLRRAGPPPPMAGYVALVTGAASGIGRACADALLAHGAAIIGLDRSPAVERDEVNQLGITTDVTDPAAQAAALRVGVERFGGIDIVVCSAGVFGPTMPIADLSAEDWRAVMAVNLDAVADLLRQTHPLLARSPVGGRVCLIGSKNVPAPGRSVSPYSASKAALTQLGRVAALEWAADGIRVNTVHPDAVFDTGLWTDETLAMRAAAYDMTVEEYKRRNLLRTEITSSDVGRVVAALCSNDFAATTGAEIPIDGGNERVI
ncbi:MAG: bifunctional aldolase/short-chain dehydrogenase [Acidimicrobiales bacterium]|nr:bifunctional aldolase/short-chain dehydrogenase [Acidimicrobiales bacterium]